MQLFVHVLYQTDRLETLLNRMLERGLSGATVLDSRGMAQILCDEDTPMFGILRTLIDKNRTESKTILAVLDDEETEVMKALVREVTGGLDKEGTGVMFTVPVSFWEGMGRKK